MTNPSHDREVLEDYVARRLDPGREDQVLRHLLSCEDCRSWVEALELLTAAVGREGTRFKHPSSDLLARYVVEPDRLTEEEHRHLRQHVSRCLPCRSEIAWTEEAIRDARRPESPSLQPDGGRGTRIALALAAGLAAAVALSWVLLRPSAESLTAHSDSKQRVLSHESLRGSLYIAAEEELLADSVTIESDGVITFRAGNTVVISEGFSVREGGVLRVELGPRDDERDSDTG